MTELYRLSGDDPETNPNPNISQPETNNYLATNFFQLNIERIPLVTYSCQSVNLPSLSISPQDLPAPNFGVPFTIPVGRYTYENISISFIVDEKMENWLQVYNWMQQMSTPEDYTTNTQIYSNKFSDGTLDILNGSYNTVRQIRFKNMFPIGISGIQFSTVTVDTEPVVATATYAFTSYEITEVDKEGVVTPQ